MVHGEKLRWLLWLRWKMMLRSYAGHAGRIVSGISLILLILIFGGGIAVSTYFGYHSLPSPANTEILFLVLTGLYLVWIMLPLLEFTFNEGLDLSKLALFPLTRLELILSLIFSTLLDIPTLGLWLMLGAVVLGFAFTGPLVAMTLLVMLVFYVQLIGISQFFLALLTRTLQSRRLRDLSILLIPLLSLSCYLFQRFAFLGVGSTSFVQNLQHAPFSPYLQWLPPGMAARAIEEAYKGNWATSFAWFGALIVTTVVIFFFWQSIVERGLVSAESGGSTRGRRRRVPSTVVSSEAVGGQAAVWTARSPLVAPVLAIALKDIKYYRRDPQLQRILVQSITTAVIFVAVYLVNTGRTGAIFSGSWTVLLAPVIGFFAFYTLTYNVLGFERQNLMTLFLYPVEPRRILWGKNLTACAFGFIEMSLLVPIVAYIVQGWALAPAALMIAYTSIFIIMGCGNFASVYLPIRMPQIGRGFRTSSGANLSTDAGCQRALMSQVVFYSMLIIIAPAAAALILPFFYNAMWIWLMTMPLSLCYGVGFYVIVTNLVATRMVERAPEILAIVAKE